jgi:hypothetical protein
MYYDSMRSFLLYRPTVNNKVIETRARMIIE